jgi:demethylmenaquinone methyltransferase/2-methoxy-6-polyprenyl-1,4-benzoquinol methylase
VNANTAEVRALFEASADTYDRVNTVISLGLDARWRGWVARRAVMRPGDRVLDAFAGTGLVGLRAARLGARVTLADISEGMLGVARKRAAARSLDVTTVVADLTAQEPCIPAGPFDAVTMVFGARYLEHPSRVIRQLAGLLRDGGTFVVLDFVGPHGGWISRLAAGYFFRVLPRIAGVLAGRRRLYDRLTETTHAMGDAGHLVSIVRDAGLVVQETRTMGFGLVVGVVGRTPA